MEEKVQLVTIFMRQPAKSGDDYDFRIPRDRIKLGLIDPSKHYEVRIYEINNGKD